MFIKKYVLLCIIPLFLSGEAIVGKWEINPKKTEQSIDKLSIEEKGKKLLLFISSAGFKSIECFKDKTCVQNAINDTNSCRGHFHWKKDKQNYILSPYVDKLCPKTIKKKEKNIITITNNQLHLLLKNNKGTISFIYDKTSSTPSKKPLNTLRSIQYNKIYKSNITDTFNGSTFSLLPTYFYIFFTNKNNFYSLVTTQSNITTTNEIKKIIQKKSDEWKLSPKEQLEELKNMPSSSDKNAIRIFSTTEGEFTPNKNGISGVFNQYFKASDVSQIHDKRNSGIKWKPARRCTQITFLPNDTLSCNNEIKYTLLNKNN